jgi:hypothetical protein
LVQLVSALVANGRYKSEWHERDEFDGIDSDGERISIVGIAVGVLRDIYNSWDERNPLRQDPPGGFYAPTARKKNGKVRVSPRPSGS